MQKPILKPTEALSLWGVVAFVVLVDQISKFWILNATSHPTLPGVEFSLVFNSGVMGGVFSDFPPVLKTVSVSSIGILLLGAYFVFQWLLPARAFLLRLGLAIFMGGVLGNLIDRIFRGRIIDFIVLKVSPVADPALNLGDLFQWLGLVLIIAGVLRDQKSLWPEKDKRRFKSIHPSYQLRFRTFVLASIAGSVLLSWVLGYSFLKSTLTQISGVTPDIISRVLLVFCCLFFFAQIIYLVSMYFVAQILSDRTAGPLFAFIRHVRKLLAGPAQGQFKLRSKDEFKELEILATEIEARLKNNL